MYKIYVKNKTYTPIAPQRQNKRRQASSKNGRGVPVSVSFSKIKNTLD